MEVEQHRAGMYSTQFSHGLSDPDFLLGGVGAIMVGKRVCTAGLGPRAYVQDFR